jgi:hypothetical protein
MLQMDHFDANYIFPSKNIEFFKFVNFFLWQQIKSPWIDLELKLQARIFFLENMVRIF